MDFIKNDYLLMFQKINSILNRPKMTNDWEENEFEKIMREFGLREAVRKIYGANYISAKDFMLNHFPSNHRGFHRNYKRKIKYYRNLFEVYEREYIRPGFSKFEKQMKIKKPLSKNHLIENEERKIQEEKIEIENKKELLIENNETSITIQFLAENSEFSLKKSGGTLGRNQECEIKILDDSISRRHAEIVFYSNSYYLKDLGSANGTYVRISDYEPLIVSSEILIGHYIILIKKRTHSAIYFQISSLFDEKEVKNCVLEFSKNKNHHKIGSCQLCSVVLENNKNIEDFHAEFKIKKNYEIGIKDLKSKYGIWKKISKLDSLKLKEGCIFKFGEYIAFKVLKISLAEKKIFNPHLIQDCEINRDQLCIICLENRKNTVLWPCKHAFTCIKCSESLEKCPICRSYIDSKTIIQF